MFLFFFFLFFFLGGGLLFYHAVPLVQIQIIGFCVLQFGISKLNHINANYPVCQYGLQIRE